MKVIISAILLCLTIACSKVKDNYVRYTGMVPISETIIPDSAKFLENIQFKAKAVETNGCWKNLNFVFRRISTFEYDLKAYGTFESYGICPDVMVIKDTLIDFKPDQKGIYLFYTVKIPYETNIDTMIVR